MTESEFKTTYVKSFLEAYKSAVSFRRWFGPVPDEDELLQIAYERADIAWHEYLVENPDQTPK